MQSSPQRHDPATTGIITIDLDGIADNWRALARYVAPAACGAVVKADAYGLGVRRIMPVLAAAGCRSFFVATPDEAHEARGLAPDATIYVLDGVMPGAVDDLMAAGAVPVLSSLAEVREWAGLAGRIGAPLKAAIQIDSGLNRMGLSANDVQRLAADPRSLEGLDVMLVMSHLACADNAADPKNEAQRLVFDALRAQLPKAPASLAASDGLMLGRAYHYDLVRPGYGLYGGQAAKGGATPVRPVLTVAARILDVREVATGETVGYAAVWRAQRVSRIAIIAAGYADGIGREASSDAAAGGGVVRIGGTLAPIAGRVSMDLITVDVTDCPAPPARGDLAEIIDAGLTIEALSIEAQGRRMGTIGYELLTRLGRRFQRVYLTGGAAIPSPRPVREEG